MKHKVVEIVLYSLLTSVYLKIVYSVDTCKKERPNIIFIMADDAGWNDFSFHGSSEIPTPNIDGLAFSGMILNRYYGSPLCTPTRGAIMTGKHPIHLRLQHFVVMGQTADGLPLTEKLISQYLQDLGYATHLVGKWHLGHSRKSYTPTKRGFDSHYGYWLGKQDYYDHFHLDGSKIGWGYDFRHNLSVNYKDFGIYATDLFTAESIRIIKQQSKIQPLFLMINHLAPHSGNAYEPLQAPSEYIEKFKSTIEDVNRRVYAAMMTKLDESVGQVMTALAETGLLENSIVIFASDNGGAPKGYDRNYGSNWPLRGAKNTLWEGGTRLAGLIWSPFTQNRVSMDVFHAQDWLPTLYEAAGGQVADLGNIDGASMWQTFTTGEPSPVRTILYNIDDIYNNSAIQHENWKLIQGNTSSKDLGGGKWDDWYGPSGRETNLSAHDLISDILASESASALSVVGMALNASSILNLQMEAEVTCNSSLTPINCDAYNVPCLFDLSTDPCEETNLATLYPDIVANLLALLDKFNKTALSPIPRVKDPDGLPSKWGYIWTTWKDFLDPVNV